MNNFVIENLYRVQLCPKLDRNGTAINACFEKQDMFDFDKDCNCFVFVNDYVQFSTYIEENFSDFMFIKSIVHISDNSFVYEE